MTTPAVLPACNVAEEALDVRRSHIGDQTPAQERLDVPLDPAAIDIEGRGLLGLAALPNDQALVGCHEVGVA
ncbi:hypothetical protein [Methylobacterium sp. E-066]|uniref:hypothetical protein n=1 Tax=Methylobacterium sp. E-066 TaxID=2836584 RepID=UPI001FB9E1DB|nr:hypothetical protein [Methylobacterium sp. E-066]MCJ2139564.1 hypothetical protein [Methylobacterium sp. E-066]